MSPINPTIYSVQENLKQILDSVTSAVTFGATPPLAAVMNYPRETLTAVGSAEVLAASSTPGSESKRTNLTLIMRRNPFMAHNTFKNTSDQTFVDGELVIRPGETVAEVNDDRAEQFRGLYSWQFEEAAAGKDSKSEAEIRQETRDYQHPVAPINNQPQVEVQVEDGNVKVEEPAKDNKKK